MVYRVLMIDPPWPKKKGGLRKVAPRQTRELDYKTMGVEDIFRLLDKEIFVQAENNHSVFLWTVDEFLRVAEEEMEKRAYRRHARIIWDKENGVAPAFSIRYSHEYLLWFYKGKWEGVEKSMRGKLTTVIREKGREHSRKPEAAYAYVEALFPAGPHLDVFSRQPRPLWDQYGDQKDFFGGTT